MLFLQVCLKHLQYTYFVFYQNKDALHGRLNIPSFLVKAQILEIKKRRKKKIPPKNVAKQNNKIN